MARLQDWDDDDPGMAHDPSDEDWPDDWRRRADHPLPALSPRDPRGRGAVPVLRALLLEGGRPPGAKALVDHRRRRRVPLRGLSLERLVVSRLPLNGRANPGPAR